MPFRHLTRRTRGAAVVLLFLLIHAFRPSAASAHGGLQPLETWGGFPASAAYCQRIIGAAAASCALQAARLRQQCLDLQSRGQSCDQTATSAAIASVRRDALDLVDLHCSERDSQTAGYLGSFDLQADIIRFCREWETVSSSAVYGTVLPAEGALDAPVYACVTAAAAATAKLAQLTFDSWRKTLDRIASRTWDLPAKMSMIDHTSERVARLQPRAAGVLPAACAPLAFESVYHRNVVDFTALLSARATCFAGAFYVQDETPCPAAVCGNWVIEPGEACDDGNTAGGDGCDAECLGP